MSTWEDHDEGYKRPDDSSLLLDQDIPEDIEFQLSIERSKEVYRIRLDRIKEWRKHHKQQYDEYLQQWRAKNPDKIAQYEQKARLKRRLNGKANEYARHYYETVTKPKRIAEKAKRMETTDENA